MFTGDRYEVTIENLKKGSDLKNLISLIAFKNDNKKIIILFKGDYIKDHEYLYTFPFSPLRSKLMFYPCDITNSCFFTNEPIKPIIYKADTDKYIDVETRL